MAITLSNQETDSRFPSGRWLGYFLQRGYVGEQQMEMQLTFSNGQLQGEGRDFVGEFTLQGDYSVESGKCCWSKQYTGKHRVFYEGSHDGRGIKGLWQITYWCGVDQEGFHIWPASMADPRRHQLKQAVSDRTPLGLSQGFIGFRATANGHESRTSAKAAKTLGLSQGRFARHLQRLLSGLRSGVLP